MAWKLAEAFVQIEARQEKFRAGLASAKTKLGVALGEMKAMAASAAASLLPVAIGAGLAAGLRSAVLGASDLAETLSKVEVVFGSSSESVKGFANQMAQDFGSSKQSMLDAAAGFGLIGKAAGLSQPEAAKMSVSLARLADDASSFYNVPLDEALLTIKSALVGEAEPIRRFGVLLNEAAVSNEAMRLGLAKTKAGLTEQAKVLARVSLIQKGMTDAQGDHARTQASFTNQLREFLGRLSNLGVSLGSIVLPLLNAFLRILNPIAAALAIVAEKVTAVVKGIGAMAQAASKFSFGEALGVGKDAKPEKLAPDAPAIAKPKGEAGKDGTPAETPVPPKDAKPEPNPATGLRRPPGAPALGADLAYDKALAEAHKQVAKQTQADAKKRLADRVAEEVAVAKKKEQLERQNAAIFRQLELERLTRSYGSVMAERAKKMLADPAARARANNGQLPKTDPLAPMASQEERARKWAEAEMAKADQERKAKGAAAPAPNFKAQRDAIDRIGSILKEKFGEALAIRGEVKSVIARSLIAVDARGELARRRREREKEKPFHAETLSSSDTHRRIQEEILSDKVDKKEEIEIAKNTRETAIAVKDGLHDLVGAIKGFVPRFK